MGGMKFTCTKCKGTGDMGFAFSNICNICHGKGEISLNESQTALYEWCEGYFDLETDTGWLERQLKKLLETRKENLANKKNNNK